MKDSNIEGFKVIDLAKQRQHEQEPNLELIRSLEMLLKDAKSGDPDSGKMQALFAVGQFSDGRAVRMYNKPAHLNASGMLRAIELLKSEVYIDYQLENSSSTLHRIFKHLGVDPTEF